jgi:hypothetical protein
MGGVSATELETFHRFIGQQLADGSELTPEQCLRVWRMEQPMAEDLKESVAAVKRALEQARRGAGKSVDDFDRDFRAKHGISERP